jgi:hypothetical protein
MDLDLVLPPSDVLAPLAQPLLSRAELSLALGERRLTVRKSPLRLLLKHRNSATAELPNSEASSRSMSAAMARPIEIPAASQ